MVLRTGSAVRNWKPGDRVTIHCNYVDDQDPSAHDDSMLAANQRIWGFESNFGGLADLTVVKANQLMPKPAHLTWEEAACNALTNSTSYRMLVSPNGAPVQQGQIGVMQTWLKDWHLLPTGTRPKMAWMPNGTKELLPDGQMPGMATDAEISQLRTATGKQEDILFCQLLLRHHLGGIHMVSAILSLTHDASVTELATAMRNGQQNEVTIMRKKLSDLGAQPLGT